MKFKDYLEKQLQDPEFRKEYEALKKQYKSPTSSMKTKFTLASTESGDWEALYINGKLAAEGHSIYIIDVFDCINDIFPNEYDEIEVSDEIAEMPDDLSDLEEDLI